jgi:predicted N-acyltransferase
MARHDNKDTVREEDTDAAAVEVAVVEGIDRIAREDWNALLAEDDSPFVDWDWLFAMENSRSAARSSGWGPCHLTIHRGKTLIAASGMG